MIRQVCVNPKQRIYLDFWNMTIQEKVQYWLVHFPYDFWWRRKYNIPFMSKEHLSITFEAMLFEFQENKMIEEWRAEKENSTANVIESGKMPKQIDTLGVDELSSISYADLEKMVNYAD